MAYVDEEIKDVVQSLDGLDGWMTWDSCQGNPPAEPSVMEFRSGRVAKVPVP